MLSIKDDDNTMTKSDLWTLWIRLCVVTKSRVNLHCDFPTACSATTCSQPVARLFSVYILSRCDAWCVHKFRLCTRSRRAIELAAMQRDHGTGWSMRHRRRGRCRLAQDAGDRAVAPSWPTSAWPTSPFVVRQFQTSK